MCGGLTPPKEGCKKLLSLVEVIAMAPNPIPQAR